MSESALYLMGFRKGSTITKIGLYVTTLPPSGGPNFTVAAVFTDQNEASINAFYIPVTKTGKPHARTFTSTQTNTHTDIHSQHTHR